MTQTSVRDKLNYSKGVVTMKNIFKILFAYSVGLLIVFSLVWRVDTLDSKNKPTMASSTNYVYNE